MTSQHRFVPFFVYLVVRTITNISRDETLECTGTILFGQVPCMCYYILNKSTYVALCATWHEVDR